MCSPVFDQCSFLCILSRIKGSILDGIQSKPAGFHPSGQVLPVTTRMSCKLRLSDLLCCVLARSHGAVTLVAFLVTGPGYSEDPESSLFFFFSSN